MKGESLRIQMTPLFVTMRLTLQKGASQTINTLFIAQFSTKREAICLHSLCLDSTGAPQTQPHLFKTPVVTTGPYAMLY